MLHGHQILQKIAAGVSKEVNAEPRGYDGSAVILSSINGEILWVTKSLSYREVSCVAWSPDGKRIIVGGHKYLYVFPLGNNAVIYIPSSSLHLRIIFFNGTNTDSYLLKKDELKLYADPGSYIVRYYLAYVPGDRRIVGDIIDYFSRHPVERTLTIETGKIYTLTPPSIEEFINMLGKLVIYGPPGSLVRITWGSSNNISFIIPDSSILEVYAVPDTIYTIHVMLPGSEDYVYVGEVLSRKGEVEQVSIPGSIISESMNTVATHTASARSLPAVHPQQGITNTKPTGSPYTVPSIFLPLTTYEAFLLIDFGCIVIVAALLVIRHRKRYHGEVEHGFKKTEEFFKEFLNEKIKGLVSGYGCIEDQERVKVNLAHSIAPKGFEGFWECCRLGCGGWGCTYLCEQDGRVAVFKVPHGFEALFEGHRRIPITIDDGFLRNILSKISSKAEEIKKLSHPNILKLLEVSKNAPILVYEFANGGSLDWQLSNGWKPGLRDIVLIGIQIGDALRYIHYSGYIHGDIKPSNIFIVDGVAKLGDFSSLVRLITMTSRHSGIAYTPGFRAPEQVFKDVRRRARELRLENRMDVYMLGNTILYSLTGNSVDGEEVIDNPQIIDKVVREIKYPKLRSLIRRMLDPDPLNRPPSEEVVKELLSIFNSIT